MGKINEDIKALTDAGGMDQEEFAPALPGEVSWDEIAKPHFLIRHAVISQNAENSKIVFHIKNIAPRVMNALSLFLRDEITKKMKPPALVEAGASPLFASQWDLVLFHLPPFRAPMIRDQILGIMDRFSM